MSDSIPQSTIEPCNLRTEYAGISIGLDEPRPRLSWKLKASRGFEDQRGLRQTAYQILVSRDWKTLESEPAALWDSGKVQSTESIFIEYEGKVLQSGQRAWWTVRVWDQLDQPSQYTDYLFWEAGLLSRADWHGKWIGSHLVGGHYSEVPAPFFRKSFELSSTVPVRQARLYVTALGLYEFRINGERIGADVLAPFWTDYHRRVQYQAFSVRPYLRPNQNVLGAILGDGWYCGYTGNIRRRQYYGDRPRLLAQLHISYEDGSEQIIATDGSWTTATGPILSSDLFMGENYDARLEMPGWDTSAIQVDSRWTSAVEFQDTNVEIVAMMGPKVSEMKLLPPVTIKKEGQRFIVDFGQNMVGVARLRVKGTVGQTIKMQFVEVLDQDGHAYTANLRTARQTDTYTLRGDPAGEIFQPRFTFHGFRYIAIDGFPSELTADDIIGVVLHSDMIETGTFECSDPLVNQLQQNIQWGQRGNFVDVPTDCPQRDERLGWTGDAQVFVRTAAFNFDVAGFFAKWTQDLRDSQCDAGTYPSYAPTNLPLHEPENLTGTDGGPAWADAGVICPWTMYLCYGDRRLIERHYHSMVRFVESMEREARPFDMIRCHPDWNGWHGFGDWLSQDGKDIFGATPKDLIGTAFFAHDAKLLAKMAHVLGNPGDVQRFTTLAEAVSAAFCRRFVTSDGLIIGNTQTAYLLALHFDLLPEPMRQSAVDALIQKIRANSNKLNTGFVGSPYLNHVLSRFGRSDVAFELLMQKQWPSWLYAVTHGATTIWERWDGWTHDKGFQDPGMNSFNHYAYGAIGAWLYQVIAGIEIDPSRPGYRHVLLQPHIQTRGPLAHAKATLETPRGRLMSEWRLTEKSCLYTIELPPNVSATVTLHGEVSESGNSLTQTTGVSDVTVKGEIVKFEVASGRYTFLVTAKEQRHLATVLDNWHDAGSEGKQ